MMVYHAIVSDPATLKLQPTEVDMASWLTVSEVHDLLQHEAAELPSGPVKQLHCTDGHPIPSSSLWGMYPNQGGEGIAEGHRFALRAWLATHEASNNKGRL